MLMVFQQQLAHVHNYDAKQQPLNHHLAKVDHHEEIEDPFKYNKQTNKQIRKIDWFCSFF